MDDEISRILESMKGEDVQLVRQAFSESLQKLKQDKESQQQERQSDLAGKSLSELGTLLARTRPAENPQYYDQLLAEHQKKINEQVEAQNQPTQDELNLAAQHYTNLKAQLSQVEAELNTAMQAPSKNFAQIRDLSQQHRNIMIEMGLST